MNGEIYCVYEGKKGGRERRGSRGVGPAWDVGDLDSPSEGGSSEYCVLKLLIDHTALARWGIWVVGSGIGNFMP